MSWFSQAKTAAGLDDARAAWDRADRSLLARYWDEVAAFQGSGPVDGAGEYIDQVEQIGWRLDTISYTWVAKKDRGVTVMLFRRQVA